MQLEVGRVAAGAVACLDAAALAVAPEGEAICGAAEVQGVAQLVMLRPALGIVGAADGGVIDELEVIAYDLMPPVGLEDMPEVQEQLAVGAIAIGGAHEADALRAGELGTDAEV